MTEQPLTRRKLLSVGGLALAGIGTAGCQGDSGPQTVSMTAEFTFDPERVTVDAGETVEWVNESDVGHTVTAEADGIPTAATYFASGDFDTEQAARDGLSEGLIEAGDRYSHTFEASGTYEYYCIPHEGSGMAGTVRVR